MTQHTSSDAHLMIQVGNAPGKRIDLWKDCTTIGRSSECDIFLEDVTVHRKQASILRTPTGFILRDDHGSGDSFVNGQPVREQLLNNGDQLLFGLSKLTFHANEGTRPFQLPSSRGRELYNGKSTIPQTPVIAHLELLEIRTGIRRSIELLPDMTIGRSRECDVFLEDLAVSRVHVTIRELSDGSFELIDNRSATGTFVNGRAIARCTLREGDNIQIGSSQFTFRLPAVR